MSETIFRYSNNTHLKKLPCRLVKRHYKKDSRFVLDLYTLTYDSHESLDSLGDLSEVKWNILFYSRETLLEKKLKWQKIFTSTTLL